MFMPMMGSKAGGDFFDAAAYWDFTTGSLVSNNGLALTFTRASDGTYFDSAGVLQTAGTNVARFDHDPSTLQSLGLLIEEARENLCLQSEDLSTTWGTSGVTINTNTALAPDGNTAADKLEEDAANSTHHVLQNGKVVSSSTTYSFCVFGSIDERTLAILNTVDPAVADHRTWFDLSAGAAGTTDASHTARIIDVGGGIYRFCVTYTTTGIQVSMNLQIGMAAVDGAHIYLGTLGEGANFWGADLKAGPPSSYVKATTGTATREAPAASAAVTLGAANTIYAEGRTGYGDGVLYQIDDGTENERYRIARVSGNIRVIVTDGGVEQANLDMGAVADQTDFKIAARLAANDIAASLDGGAIVSDVGATLPTVTTYRPGMDTTGSHWNSTKARDALWITGKADSFLRQIST